MLSEGRLCFRALSGIGRLMARESKLLCSFGIIADVQYADIDDGMNYSRTNHRYYRHALELVTAAVRDWSGGPTRAEFILQLGDLIDGYNSKLGASRSALDAAMAELTKGGHFVYHVLGNHDLYNFGHDELLTCDHMKSSFLNNDRLSTPFPGSTGYYHFAPTEGFRIVVLDNYEISMLGQADTSTSYRQAEDILRHNNCNTDWNSSLGLSGVTRRFVKFNGAVSTEQLCWLDALLTKSDEDHEVVLVAGHIPLYRRSSDYICLAWNYEDVLAVLRKHRCVIAYLAGHTHCGAYSRDETGIHHVVFPGVIEAAPGCPAAHATVLLYPNSVVIKTADGSGMSDIVMDIGGQRLNE